MSKSPTLTNTDPVTTVPTPFANSRVKRVFDVSIALISLVFVLTSALFIFVANLFSSPGPLIFKQSRVGKDGQIFTLFKFRSMKTPIHSNNCGLIAPRKQPISLVSKILRKFHIDELPQMWNVLIGDMSIIGPRPYIVEECARLNSDVIGFENRHSVKPGITGLAQVNYNHLNTGEDARTKLQDDFVYINKCSFMLDISIIVKTVLKVVTMRGV